MVQVTYPGVYIQEVPSGVRTITSVATSIGAFFGRATKGPINQAERILSLADFERIFGEPHPQSDLAFSVRQFFKNGGTDCYVVRLANGATPAALTLQSLITVNLVDEVLVATAKAEGAWGNTVRLEVDYDTQNADDTFNLRVIHEEGGVAVQTESFSGLSMKPTSPRFAPDFVTQSSVLIDLELGPALEDPSDPTSFINEIANSFAGFSQGRRPLGVTPANARDALNAFFGLATPQTSIEISINDGQWVLADLSQGGNLSGNEANWTGQLRSRIEAALQAADPSHQVTVVLNTVAGERVLRITSDSGDESSVRIRRAPANDISVALMMGVDQGGVEATRFSNFRPAPNATLFRLENEVGAIPGNLDAVTDLSALAQPGFTQIDIDGNTVALNTADFDIHTDAAPGSLWIANAPGGSPATGDNDGVREKLRIIANAINAANIDYRAEVWGYHLAIMATAGTINQQPSAPVSTTPAAVSFTNGVTENVRQYSLGSPTGGPFSVNPAPVGNDGSAPLEADYLGNEADQTGFNALDPVDLFNLMIIPGDEEVPQATLNALWGPASNYCSGRRAFLLVDPPTSWTVNDRPEVVGDTALINDLRSTVVKDYSAVFYPRLRYSRNGLIRSIGPAGAIAGLMSRIDASRGVWKTPAGLEAGIREILGLELKLTDPENGVLNKKGVNCLRIFPAGIVNWGGRTMDGDDDFGSEWKYVAVRRVALMIEESLFRGTKWVVFEPNDEPLWALIRMNLGAFMNSLFRQGAFQGTSPAQAFYVKCDAETTTQNDINQGIVNIEVGFAPLKPAEFVVIKIQQIAGDL